MSNLFPPKSKRSVMGRSAGLRPGVLDNSLDRAGSETGAPAHHDSRCFKKTRASDAQLCLDSGATQIVGYEKGNVEGLLRSSSMSQVHNLPSCKAMLETAVELVVAIGVCCSFERCGSDRMGFRSGN